MGGAHEFNDVFLDGALLSADKVIGAVGQGWAIAMSGLETERFGVGGNVLLLNVLLDDLAEVVRHLRIGSDAAITRPDIRGDIAALTSEAQAARAFVALQVDQALAGTDQPADASIAKLLYTETYGRIARYGVSLVAEHGPVPDSVSPQTDRLRDAWLWSRALTISGGSSEVMRNIIAKRRLHLPQ
jgi:alkylation response protein AidB-like acyl-CoA dehydrogenase